MCEAWRTARAAQLLASAREHPRRIGALSVALPEEQPSNLRFVGDRSGTWLQALPEQAPEAMSESGALASATPIPA